MRTTLTVLLQLILLNGFSQNEKFASTANRIHEEQFIKINGIEQWVTIKGDSTKPVILFIHGGPGNPMSPFADAVYGKWEKDFVLVQWDQRGAGRTYGINSPEELTPEYLRSNPLTIDQMTSDGINIAQYLVQRLRKRKIILFGTSWGSVLAVKMAIKKPELFYAYVGHSQLVYPDAGEAAAYQQVYGMVQNAKDQQSLDILNSIGAPPYEIAKSTGQFMRVVKKYQQINSIPAPPSWFELPPEYDNEKDRQSLSDGDDYSFVNYAGDKKLGIASLSSTINLLRDGLTFKIPVYFIQGEDDIQTPAVITKEYYKNVKAPQKKIIVLEKTDHGFNQSVVDAQYKIVTEFILPLVNGD